MKETKPKSSETPLMKQYNQIKAKYVGALILFRVGDFYETFGEDAVVASQILGITLTKRANGAASHIELAGFPYHSLDTYLSKLVRAGRRVAICDQLEDPKTAVGIVKRGVTELVTPGVSMHENTLNARENNFLAALHFTKTNIGLALLDISTGEFYCTQGTISYISRMLENYSAAEIIYNKNCKLEYSKMGSAGSLPSYSLDDWVFEADYAHQTLVRHFQTASLKGFGLEHLPEAVVAAGAALHYLAQAEHHQLHHIRRLARIEEDEFVWLDRFTIRNLELVSAQQAGGRTLVHVLDHTQTPMGGRLLRRWITAPLKQLPAIEERLEAVGAFVADRPLARTLSISLKSIGDLERLAAKIAVRRVGPRQLLHLKNALECLPGMIEQLSDPSAPPCLQALASQIMPCQTLKDYIGTRLKEELPLLANQGDLIQENIDQELDELRRIAYTGKDYLLELQKKEAERTKIPSLKISYNKVFGYFLEVTHAHRDKVPIDWIRKQTLVNAERYITQELKIYEEKILTAQESIYKIELNLFDEMVEKAAEALEQIQQNAHIAARLDCLLSLAEAAHKYKYCRPELDMDVNLEITDGRHPVIERQMPDGESYISNSVAVDEHTCQIMVITGPNMSGKSALLRQTALIVLMAQMGSFVPASSAKIGLVDKIFTRVGASDNLAGGESTFMVEMSETASILNNLSGHSLVIMDEIGRGTSTYDGISIAWAIVEYLHNQPIKMRPRTLFATHYHELNELASQLERVHTFNVLVQETESKVIFMRKLEKGPSQHSFGIHVARMAGIPATVVSRANQVMHLLESNRTTATHTKKALKSAAIPAPAQLNIFEPIASAHLLKIQHILQNLEINSLAPIEALLKLEQLQHLAGKAKGEN